MISDVLAGIDRCRSSMTMTLPSSDGSRVLLFSLAHSSPFVFGTWSLSLHRTDFHLATVVPLFSRMVPCTLPPPLDFLKSFLLTVFVRRLSESLFSSFHGFVIPFTYIECLHPCRDRQVIFLSSPPFTGESCKVPERYAGPFAVPAPWEDGARRVRTSFLFSFRDFSPRECLPW